MNRVVVGIAVAVLAAAMGGWATIGIAVNAAGSQPNVEAQRVVIEHPGGVIETNSSFYVGRNEELVFAGPTEIRARGPIIIDGIMRVATPDAPGVDGSTLTLSSIVGIVIHGELHGSAGSDGSETGQSGGAGGRMELHAPLIVSRSTIQAPDGGRGGPGGGKGGTGGSLYVAAFGYQIGSQNVPVGTREYEQPAAKSGRGGAGGDGNAQNPNGGAGGAGGSARAERFKELPWMVKYRHLWMLSDEEIAEAKARGEIR